MSVVSDAALNAVGQITSSLTPALLVVFGALLLLVVTVFGYLKLHAQFTGQSSNDVSYKMGRIFGALVYEADYDKYKERRERSEMNRERNAGFSRRYRREKGL